MIIQIKKGDRVFQAYKEIGITRNIIVSIYELFRFNSPVFNCEVTDHKFIKSRGTHIGFHELAENDIKLVNIAKGIIKKC